MNLLCKLFGHKPPSYTQHTGGEYYKTQGVTYVDGIGRPHLDLTAACPRCSEIYFAGRVHALKWHGEKVDPFRHQKIKEQA